jgi:hypothetical protein
MTTCSCGFTPMDDESLADHLGEMFIPDDDTDKGGRRHVETELRTCLCGYVAPDAADLDAHLLAAFTSPGRLGRDGQAHKPVEESVRS